VGVAEHSEAVGERARLGTVLNPPGIPGEHQPDRRHPIFRLPSNGTAAPIARWCEAGLDAAVLLFFPLLVLLPRGIAALVSIVFVIPALISVLGPSWKNAIYPYLPTNAGAAITSIHQQAHTLAPWTGFGLFLGYTAALLAVAAILLRRRDT